MLLATIFNINDGIALFGMQLLFSKLFVVVTVVIGFIVDVPDPGVMKRPPRRLGTTRASASMTMAFAIVALSAVNLGLVMRREREPAWASPVFPYLGWIILGWALAWAAVELPMLQRLLDIQSLTGAEWALVLGLSLITPGLVWVDKTIALSRQTQSGLADPTLDPAARPAGA